MKARGRIDGMSALADAIFVMPNVAAAEPEYKVFFV